MSRTNIDIDDQLLECVMRRYGFTTKQEAIDYAMRAVYVEPMTRTEMLKLEGMGWHGDLDAMRGRESAASAAS